MGKAEAAAKGRAKLEAFKAQQLFAESSDNLLFLRQFFFEGGNSLLLKSYSTLILEHFLIYLSS